MIQDSTVKTKIGYWIDIYQNDFNLEVVYYIYQNDFNLEFFTFRAKLFAIEREINWDHTS